ncbi:unnamed protein product [Ixodes hexagonus]
MENECLQFMDIMQARLRQVLVMEMELDSVRAETETVELALLANSFTIAVLAVQSVERIERELWSYQRGESWFETTLPHLGERNFKACFRVLPCTFRYLVDVCRPVMERQATNMRQPISVEKRVAIGLYKLCSTAEDRTIAHLFGVGRSTVNGIYREFSDTIVARLEQTSVAMVCQNELQNHMLEFEAVCGFPSAIGALDGSHLAVSPPKDQDCDYRNYKGWYSIILLAIVDHRYTFRYVNVGSPGKCHDSHVYRNSRLPALLSGLQAQTPLVVNGTAVPPIVLCDQAFPLTPNLMKLFPHGVSLTRAQGDYNYCLSKSRRIVENAFGRLKARFRIIMKRTETKIENLNSVVRASCILHNVCERFNDPVDPQTLRDTLKDIEEARANQPVCTTSAEESSGPAVRAALVNYFAAHPELGFRHE